MSDRKPAHRDPDLLAETQTGRPARAGGRRAISLGVLNDHLGYFIRHIQLWVFQDFIRALASVDVRPAQYSVLVVTEANPGLSQSDLARLLHIERARLVRLLDLLEKRGFIERQRSRTDRRSHALHLTREGQRRLKRIKELAGIHEERLTRKLGPAKRKLLLEILRDFGR